MSYEKDLVDGGGVGAHRSPKLIGQDESYSMLWKDGWQMQSEGKVTDAGSCPFRKQGIRATGWYKVSVPTTIIAGLLGKQGLRL
jgi:hypothetical protein